VKVVCFAEASSAPADLAVLLLKQELGEALRDATVVLRLRSGLFNGGTIASMREAVESGDAKRERDPFLLGPRDRRPTPRERDPAGVRWDRAQHAWRTQSPLGVSDTRVIRFSSSLRGADVEVQEYLAFDGATGVVPALLVRVGFGAVTVALRTRIGRALLTRIAPPGGGPSEREGRTASYHLDVTGTGASRPRSRVTMTFDGDPGNYVTALCAAEIAIALCLGGSNLPDRTGILTPRTAIGAGLADRLIGAGMRLTPGQGQTNTA